jgi:hypothetical protein
MLLRQALTKLKAADNIIAILLGVNVLLGGLAITMAAMTYILYEKLPG